MTVALTNSIDQGYQPYFHYFSSRATVIAPFLYDYTYYSMMFTITLICYYDIKINNISFRSGMRRIFSNGTHIIHDNTC